MSAATRVCATWQTLIPEPPIPLRRLVPHFGAMHVNVGEHTPSLGCLGRLSRERCCGGRQWRDGGLPNGQNRRSSQQKSRRSSKTRLGKNRFSSQQKSRRSSQQKSRRSSKTR